MKYFVAVLCLAQVNFGFENEKLAQQSESAFERLNDIFRKKKQIDRNRFVCVVIIVTNFAFI